MKAVLLSAVVFPGTGHFYLKKYFSGVLLSVTASVCSYLIIMNFTIRILTLFEKIQSGEIVLDFLLMMQFILTEPEDPAARLSAVVWIAMMICWLIAIFDSYRIAKKSSSIS